MEKKNEVLIFAVVLLGILVLILGGYIIYDKVIVNKNKEISNMEKAEERGNNGEKELNDIENEKEKSETTKIEINYEEIAKEKMPTIVSLVNQGKGAYKYCGDINQSDYIIIDNMRFVASSNFITIYKLQDHLYSTITRDLFIKYFDAHGYDQEKDKLYCKNLPADGLYASFRSESRIKKLDNLNYQILNITDNSFDVIMTFDYYSQVDSENNGEHTNTATFIKENDVWLISSFEG